MAAAPLKFADRASLALDDSNLRAAMEAARKGLFASSDEAMAHPDFQHWREQGRRLRDGALASLDTLLERFEERAVAAGAQVHWAADAAEARALVVGIARELGCRRAIKSKSMLSEELGLNDALEESGAQVLETDLGEYIVQISGGRPSHIIAPVVHMTGDEIADLFVSAHGGTRKTVPADLVAEARRVLRPQMMGADVGITGANFLVAETGSSVIVTNEGNGRFAASIPPARITVAGIEKVVPAFADVAKLLRLLPRAATGQTSTAYVTISTGTSAGGPERHHIVLVDNGRSRMLAGKYRDMLRCIRCGACMNHCPVYLLAGGLSYNSPYVGPMGAVLSPNLFGAAHNDLPHGATMCGACDEVCPVKIPLAGMMRSLREDQADAGAPGAVERLAMSLWAVLARHPAAYAIWERLAARALRMLAGRKGRITRLPGARGWFSWRDLPAPAKGVFRDIVRKSKRAGN